MAEDVKTRPAEEVKPGEIAKTIEFDGEEFEVLFAKGTPGRTREELDAARRQMEEEGREDTMGLTFGYCAPYQPRTYATEMEDVICERDQACTLRDGTIIYADIYRPITTKKVPVICVFGPSARTRRRAWTPGS